ncbi:hypothetical protein EV699_113121 [Plasticicumulans lactativorans]|uniref:Uncharacterized protein n=1 Tax=Plasticicumulans lactativorans TaxID=1133106 RepID=A0A4R2L2R4_9GAMM|nr:hypothetical protein [Plasticicumulans lactativorans]TCO80643.1 hypothetical protein EV699_113121 [Plasticicumulans lactativorans]
MSAVAVKHPWLLLGPWYRWAVPGRPSAGRGSRPQIQKYDSSKLVDTFLADPQRSLRYTDEDRVHVVQTLAPLVPALWNGLRRRLADTHYAPSATRKLFLDLHKRFYLLVCELHCDAAGLPSVDRNDVCEAGFVLRRRVVRGLTPAALDAVKPVIEGLASARAELGLLDGMAPADERGWLARALGGAVFDAGVAGAREGRRALAEARLGELGAQFDAWVATYGISSELQGWRVLADRVGRWEAVGETPEQTFEQVLPLYPRVPDPRQPDTGYGRTLYFGLVPTGAADVDEAGKPKLDADTRYELRAFVRRRKPGCPQPSGRPPGKPVCKGQVYWSLSTETFQLAAPFDLDGTSHQPVNVPLPDLNALRAQAASARPEHAALRLVAPPDSQLEFTADDAANVVPGLPSGQICSFSIPLITIVATFVFKLFLGLVVLIFNLWFLLAFRFCFPPSISLSAGVSAELDARLPSIEADFAVSLEADFEADFFGPPPDDALEQQIDLHFDANARAATVDPLAPVARARLVGGVAGASAKAGRGEIAPLAGLEYEVAVQPETPA